MNIAISGIWNGSENELCDINSAGVLVRNHGAACLLKDFVRPKGFPQTRDRLAARA